jgi:hypothetical protein
MSRKIKSTQPPKKPYKNSFLSIFSHKLQCKRLHNGESLICNRLQQPIDRNNLKNNRFYKKDIRPIFIPLKQKFFTYNTI